MAYLFPVRLRTSQRAVNTVLFSMNGTSDAGAPSTCLLAASIGYFASVQLARVIVRYEHSHALLPNLPSLSGSAPASAITSTASRKRPYKQLRRLLYRFNLKVWSLNETIFIYACIRSKG